MKILDVETFLGCGEWIHHVSCMCSAITDRSSGDQMFFGSLLARSVADWDSIRPHGTSNHDICHQFAGLVVNFLHEYTVVWECVLNGIWYGRVWTWKSIGIDTRVHLPSILSFRWYEYLTGLMWIGCGIVRSGHRCICSKLLDQSLLPFAERLHQQSLKIQLK